MSYAAKWVPTPAHGADKQLCLASALGLLLFPGEGISESREKLQRHVLSPLRKVISVPEVEMVHGPWTINYNKVRPSAGNQLTGTGTGASDAAQRTSFHGARPKGIRKVPRACAVGVSPKSGGGC